MKIGIIVHSHTGNTFSVAEKLKEKFMASRHSVNIERLKPVDPEQSNARLVKLETVPDSGVYDALVFAGPVRAFSISPVIAAYLNQLSALGRKKVACFVTMHFPFFWMGGRNAVLQMQKLCSSKGGSVCGTGIVSWSSKQREKQITTLVDNLCSLF